MKAGDIVEVLNLDKSQRTNGHLEVGERYIVNDIFDSYISVFNHRCQLGHWYLDNSQFFLYRKKGPEYPKILFKKLRSYYDINHI